MKIMFSVILSVLAALLLTNLYTKQLNAKQNVFTYRQKLDRLHAIQEASRVVRQAWDMGETIRNTPGVACPAETRQVNLGDGRFLCWPVNDMNLCINNLNGYFTCPFLNDSGIPSVSLASNDPLKDWFPTLFPKAMAISIGHTAIPLIPRNLSGGPADSVRIIMPACNWTNDYCVQCADDDVSCITMTLCIETDKVTNCARNRRIIQTFAIRD